MLDFLVNLWYHTCMKDKFMTDSTLDLFCQHEDAMEADKFASYVEELASKYEVTCDYIIQEFILE